MTSIGSFQGSFQSESEQQYDSSSSDSEHYIDPLSNLYDSLPPHYWQIRKIVKFVKTGNQAATFISLKLLKDCDLSDEFNQFAVRNNGGLETLINLLETRNYDCVSASLDVLNELASNKFICRDMINLGAVPVVVQLLDKNNKKVLYKAALLISTIAGLIKRAQKLVHAHGGIPLLIYLCEMPSLNLLQTPAEKLSKEKMADIKTCAASAKALYSLSRLRAVKTDMIKEGILKTIPRLLNSVHDEIVLYTMGFFQNCATEVKCQIAIETEGIMQRILDHLQSKTIKLRELCAQAIFKSCEKEELRKLFYYHGGCRHLVKLLRDKEASKDTYLMTAVTGAIWKCSLYDKNLQELDSLGVLKLLLPFMKNEDEDLLINVMGAVGEMVRLPKNRTLLHKEGAIRIIVSYLNYINHRLLINIVKILDQCACDKDCLQELEDLDAFRFVWSLLKNLHSDVQAIACFALVPFIVNMKDAGEAVRSLVDGLNLLIAKLKSRNEFVLAGACAAISKVALDRENLAVMCELGVTGLLAQHINTKSPLLRQHLASAIAECCWWQENCRMFGELGICSRIVDYIKTNNEAVKLTAAQAMCALSFDPFNCITLHRNGVVPYLLEAVSSQEEELQIAAAGCLANIRHLALYADEVKYNSYV